jgi:sulfur carrier protein ThiS
MSKMCVIVKLVQLGKKVEEFEVSDDATIGGLHEKAGITFRAGSVTVNQECVDESYELEDGDVVYVGATMKGNVSFTVKLIRLGNADPIIELPCESGMSIKATIDQLPENDRKKFYKEDGSDLYEYRISGHGDGSSVSANTTIPNPANLDEPVKLILGARTKGNDNQ